jgi:hypothetical protein
VGTIDLGAGVRLELIRWDPDKELNPQYAHLNIPEGGVLWGGILKHPLPAGQVGQTGSPGECQGGIAFDFPWIPQSRQPRWTVESFWPLTLSPSILCGCGFHGFVRQNRWVAA